MIIKLNNVEYTFIHLITNKFFDNEKLEKILFLSSLLNLSFLLYIKKTNNNTYLIKIKNKYKIKGKISEYYKNIFIDLIY